MKVLSLENELNSLSYHGRGIIIGKSADAKKAVMAYFIMGRSVNSRNRVFVAEGENLRTKAFDESKMTDPHLIIYYPVRVLGNTTIVTNGYQTDTIYQLMALQRESPDQLEKADWLLMTPDYYNFLLTGVKKNEYLGVVDWK